MFKNNLSKYFLIIFLIFSLDRLSKLYIIFLDEKNNGLQIYSSKYLNIELFWNTGIAFGLFSFSEKFFYHLITLIIILIILFIFLMISKSDQIQRYFLLFILGGAIGNLFDRIYYNAVPDFIDFHIQNFHWFIFNVADIFISFGVIFMILIEIIVKKKRHE